MYINPCSCKSLNQDIFVNKKYYVKCSCGKKSMPANSHIEAVEFWNAGKFEVIVDNCHGCECLDYEYCLPDCEWS